MPSHARSSLLQHIPSKRSILLIAGSCAFSVLMAALTLQWLIYDDWLHKHGPLRVVGSALAGASALELGFHRAAWARALAPSASAKLFDIEKVADGVYAAIARAQAAINSNAAIFVNSEDVLVVDAHSKPSAAAMRKNCSNNGPTWRAVCA